ncbi:hypothetical protein ScPMuIL_013476 [Solemya velum]
MEMRTRATWKQLLPLPTLTFWLALSLLFVYIDTSSIHKRNIFQLCDMIRFYTHRSCVDFNNYGCFCGYGQNGRKPLDQVDACCKKHDSCYGDVACYFFYPQFVTFQINCDAQNGTCQCLDTSACSRSVCECDKRFAECLQRAQYNEIYHLYDRELCTEYHTV